MKGAITAIIFGTFLYGFGLFGGACGIAKGWRYKAEQAAYEKGYRDGARAVHKYLQEARAKENKEA